jgi:hypothetical protein
MNSKNVKHALDTVRDGQDNGLVDRAILAGLADHYGWTINHSDKFGRVDIYHQPNGLHVTLRWTGDVLTYAERGTRVSAVTVDGDRYSAPEMVQLAAMFLSDGE